MAVSRTILEFGKVKDFGVDVMYGLPGQTESSICASLDSADYFAPTSIGLLPLRPTAGTPFYRRVVTNHGRSIKLTHHRNLPTRDEKLACFAAADASLVERGFAPYTAWHYAKPGYEGLYHRLMQQDIDRIELGVGGASLTDDLFVRTTSDLDRYLKKAGDPAATVASVEQVDAAGRRRLFVRGGLSLSEGLSLAACRERYGEAPGDEVWGPLVEEGLVTREDDTVRLTLAGRCFADEALDRAEPALV